MAFNVTSLMNGAGGRVDLSLGTLTSGVRTVNGHVDQPGTVWVECRAAKALSLVTLTGTELFNDGVGKLVLPSSGTDFSFSIEDADTTDTCYVKVSANGSAPSMLAVTFA